MSPGAARAAAPGRRVWHQSFTALGDVPAYRDALRARVDALARPGTTVTLHGVVPGTYSSAYPGGDLGFSGLFAVHGLQWLAAAREAERQGFDAMVCATMSNPLVAELRSLVDITVVGYGEAVVALSALYGRRFGLLSFMAGRQDFWPEMLRRWGQAERFAGQRAVETGFAEVIAGLADPDAQARVVAAVEAAGERLVAETGADVVIPSEMPLNLLLARAGCHAIAGAGVMDGLATSLALAETLCDLRQAAGMRPSARGFFHARPERQRIDEVMAFYGIDALGARIPEG